MKLLDNRADRAKSASHAVFPRLRFAQFFHSVEPRPEMCAACGKHKFARVVNQQSSKQSAISNQRSAKNPAVALVWLSAEC
jgi:hypothetical protein